MGAGGERGWDFHIGALAALRDATGVTADAAGVAVGTSAGALLAAYVTNGVALEAVASHVGGLPDAEHPGGATGRPPRGWLEPVAPAVRRGIGAVVRRLAPRGGGSTVGMSRELVRRTGGRWPDVDLRVVVTDRATGRGVITRDDGVPLPDAVRASVAVPGVYEPFTDGGRTLVDGGVRSMTNADLLPADRVDVVVVIAPNALDGDRPSAGALLPAAVHRWTLERELAPVRAAGVPVVVIAPPAPSFHAGGDDRRRRVAIGRGFGTDILATPPAAEAVAVLRAVTRD